MRVRAAEGERYLIRCPACRSLHVLDSRWKFNGNFEGPTFQPSLRVQTKDQDGTLIEHCHSYITDGNIEYLPDSLHELRGQTVPLPDFPE